MLYALFHVLFTNTDNVVAVTISGYGKASSQELLDGMPPEVVRDDDNWYVGGYEGPWNAPIESGYGFEVKSWQKMVVTETGLQLKEDTGPVHIARIHLE